MESTLKIVFIKFFAGLVLFVTIRFWWTGDNSYSRENALADSFKQLNKFFKKGLTSIK